MTNNNNCENYPNCRNCNKWADCWSKGNITAPNPFLDLELNKYYGNVNYSYDGELYLNSTSIKCNSINDGVLHLIKWELEYRGKHNSNPNRLTTKPIDVANIIDWYNCNYGANITENDLKGLNIQY